MGLDRKTYRLNRRKDTTIFKFNSEKAYFRQFFPRIDQRIQTNELIDKQLKVLKLDKYKKLLL